LAKSFVKADSLRLNIEAQISPKQRSAGAFVLMTKMQAYPIDESTIDCPPIILPTLLSMPLWQPVSDAMLQQPPRTRCYGNAT
jgi:hypothetical protein